MVSNVEAVSQSDFRISMRLLPFVLNSRMDPDVGIELDRLRSDNNGARVMPEKALVLTVLLQAQEEYTGVRMSSRGRYEKVSVLSMLKCEIEDLNYWVERESRELFSLNYCCDVLDLDVSLVRKRLMWMKAHAKELVSGKRIEDEYNE